MGKRQGSDDCACMRSFSVVANMTWFAKCLVPRSPAVVCNSYLCSLHWQQGTTLMPFQHPAPTPQYGSFFCENHIFSLLSWETKYKSSLSQSLFQHATFPTAILNPKSILHHFLPQPSIWDLFPCSALLLVSTAGLVGANQTLNCLIFVRLHFLQLHLLLDLKTKTQSSELHRSQVILHPNPCVYLHPKPQMVINVNFPN